MALAEPEPAPPGPMDPVLIGQTWHRFRMVALTRMELVELIVARAGREDPAAVAIVAAARAELRERRS